MNREEFYAQVEQHYRDNYRKLIIVMAPRVRGRINAEDVVQDAYTRMCTYWKSYDLEHATLDVWFEQILTNCARSFMTKEKRHGMGIDDNPGPNDVPIVDHRGPGMVELSEVLDRIKDKHVRPRLILTMALISQHKYADIADAMGVSTRWVERVVHDFREELAA